MANINNRVSLIGRLGADPEMRELEEGKKMARFNVAVDESYRDVQGQRVEKTHWQSVVAWGPNAERVSKVLAKGRLIALEGKLVGSSYTDKEGVKRYSTDVQMSEFMALDPKPVEA